MGRIPWDVDGSRRDMKGVDCAFVRRRDRNTGTPAAVFHKGVLTRFEDREGEIEGTTIPGTRQATQKSAGCHPLLTEANIEAVNTVIFGRDERGRLLTWETRPGPG